MDKIIKDITKNRANYCHIIEVSSYYELNTVIDELYNQFVDEYTIKDILEFFNTIEVYCTYTSEEDEVYSFDIENYIMSELCC